MECLNTVSSVPVWTLEIGKLKLFATWINAVYKNKVNIVWNTIKESRPQKVQWITPIFRILVALTPLTVAIIYIRIGVQCLIGILI